MLCCVVLQLAVLRSYGACKTSCRRRDGQLVTCLATPNTASLSANLLANHVGYVELQDLLHFNTSLSLLQPPYQTLRYCQSHSFFFHAVTIQTDHQNSVCGPRFPLLCTAHLELLRHLHCSKLITDCF